MFFSQMRTAAILGFKSQLSSRTGRLSIICHFLCSCFSVSSTGVGVSADRTQLIYAVQTSEQTVIFPGSHDALTTATDGVSAAGPSGCPTTGCAFFLSVVLFPTRGCSLLHCNIFTIRAKHTNATPSYSCACQSQTCI